MQAIRLRTMVIFLSIVTIGLAFGLYSREYRRSLRSLWCSSNAALIATAMHQYHVKYRTFPPAYIAGPSGAPAHSWRILVLEFMDKNLYDSYDFTQPWNSPNNLWIGKKVDSFSCPNDKTALQNGFTSYVAIVGDHTLFRQSRGVTFSDVGNPGETICIVEVKDSGIHWMEPKDLTLDDYETGTGDLKIATYDRVGPLVLVVDGTYHRVKQPLTPEQLRKVSAINE